MQPPLGLVEVFHGVTVLPLDVQSRSSERRDVCLGFCYDPAAAMGFLYSNQRCFNAGRGWHCS